MWRFQLDFKARQQGISTFFLIWHLDAALFTPNCNTVVNRDLLLLGLPMPAFIRTWCLVMEWPRSDFKSEHTNNRC